MYKRWHLHGKTLGNERHRLSNGQWLINYWLTASAGQDRRVGGWIGHYVSDNITSMKGNFSNRDELKCFWKKKLFRIKQSIVGGDFNFKIERKRIRDSSSRLLIAMQSVSVRYTVSILNRRRRRRRKITIIKTRRGRRKIKTEKTKIPVVSVTTSFHF